MFLFFGCFMIGRGVYCAVSVRFTVLLFAGYLLQHCKNRLVAFD